MKSIYCAFYWWLILSWSVPRRNAEKRTYMTYNMTTICKSHQDRFKITMHHTGTGSTGILFASDYLSETSERTCKAVIRPPMGYGVIFNVKQIDLRMDHNYDCRDYIKIYNETTGRNKTSPMCRECCKLKQVRQICTNSCGYDEDGKICEKYCGQDNNTVHITTGRYLAVLYSTKCGSCTDEKEHIGFNIEFTAYKILLDTEACDQSSSFQCKNGKCIWAGLVCDTHNNCGDMSDEDNAHCGSVPASVKALIVASAVIATILLGVVLAYLPRLSGLGSYLCQKKAKATQHLKQRRGKSNKPTSSVENENEPQTNNRLPHIREDPPTDTET